MKRSLLFTVFLIGCTAGARTLSLVRLPPPEHPDTEVSEDYPFDLGSLQAGDFCFSLELDATPTNNVELSFGFDSDGDGRLAADEERLVFGWDCGEWVLKGVYGEGVAMTYERASDAAATDSVRKHVDWRLAALRHRPAGLVLTENGLPIFSLLAGNPPAWLRPGAWNRVKVTARGVDAPNELARVKLHLNGTRLIWR